MLEVKNVSKCFDDQLVLNQLSFEIQDQEIVALLGHNGSGKTTTIKLLAGLIQKDKGEILMDGQPLHFQDVAFLPEERSLYDDATVYQQLTLLAKLAKLEQIEQRLDETLQKFQLFNQKDCCIGQLSKGNQQKVALLSALVKPSKLLLLDEPFTGLDHENIQLFEEMILQYRSEGRIVILSSHHYEPIHQYCDRYLLLKQGCLVQQMTKAQLLQDQRRVIEIDQKVEIKNYQTVLKQQLKNKYIFENETEARKTLRYLLARGNADYQYRHIQMEDLVTLICSH